MLSVEEIKKDVNICLNAIFTVEDTKNLDADILSSIDSFSFIQLIVELENYFSVQFNPDILMYENFNTTDKIIEIIQGNL